MPTTFSLLNWTDRALRYIDVALSPASVALGTLEVYTSTAPHASGQLVFDTSTYIGTPPKRESFPPLETLLTAQILGRRLDKDCIPGLLLDDCVATALQYAGLDGVIGHWVAGSGNHTVVEGGQLWDYLYSGVLVSAVTAGYPDYNFSAQLGASLVANALRWHGALVAMGGAGETLPDFNVSGFDFGTMTPIADPDIYRQPSSAAGVAWLAMAALEWQQYRNGSSSPELQEALRWSLRYLDQLRSGFFENLVGYGALAAARSNAAHNTTYDVQRMLELAFQNGTANQKHGWGVATGAWGGTDVGGLVGFIEAWDPSQPYGAGGSEVYLADGLWLAGAVAPIVRYNASFARSVGRWLVHLCSASRHFFPDQLPTANQTDWGDARNGGGAFAYEALRACAYVRELGRCVGAASPFATGDYGCEWPSGPDQPSHCGSPPPPCTNLAGYASASVGTAAALCAATDTRAVLQSDLMATDAFHALARPTFLLYNPHPDAREVAVAVPGCAMVHWAAAGAKTPGPGLCALVDAVSGAVVARGVRPATAVAVTMQPDTAYVLSCIPDGGDIDL